ncbi:MAG: hypothetical protein DMF72_03380 [Acidobacteria bacterium]|nr:MAG: hypothetical protein DMF72_03380 [Acidobacteriota bacterium]
MTYNDKPEPERGYKPFGPKDRLLLILACTLLLVVIILLFWCLRRDRSTRGSGGQPSPTPMKAGLNPAELPLAHVRRSINGSAFQLVRFQVVEGNEDGAKNYYRQTVSPQIGFLTPDTILGSSIKDLLEYFGYPGVTPKDLHRLSSDEIMKLSPPGDILATRFFAPKITAVATEPTLIPASGFGWRKLVRLKAKAGSLAAKNGMDLLLFLQNIFEKTVAGNPFDIDRNVSRFNQVIVTRKEGEFSPAKRAAYFFAYSELIKIDKNTGQPIKDANGNFADDGKISFSLQATFDGRDPETNLAPKDYFVPDSCLQCHGADKSRGKANYLDTDHWIDRVTPDYGLSDPKFKEEDFTALASAPYDVIFDGARDPGKFQKAFDVIRLLNEDIRDQNQRISDPDNFQLNAVNKWLNLHSPGNSGTAHVPPYQRGFGNQLWEPGDQSHRKILYYLNRYCYRCHSSVVYNVFDREAVSGYRGQIPGRVVNISQSEKWMPQDRIFPGLEIDQTHGTGVPTGNLKEFLDLLAQLQP